MASSVALGKISVTLLLVIVSCVVGEGHAQKNTNLKVYRNLSHTKVVIEFEVFCDLFLHFKGPCGSVQWVSPGAADLLSEDRLVRVHGQNFCREEGRGSVSNAVLCCTFPWVADPVNITHFLQQVYVGAVDDGRCFLFIGEDDLQEAKKFKVGEE